MLLNQILAYDFGNSPGREDKPWRFKTPLREGRITESNLPQFIDQFPADHFHGNPPSSSIALSFLLGGISHGKKNECDLKRGTGRGEQRRDIRSFEAHRSEKTKRYKQMKRTVSEINGLEDNAKTASAAASNTLETYPYDILYAVPVSVRPSSIRTCPSKS